MIRPEIPAYVLAGGRSTRFDGDKALTEIGGQPQILRLTEKLQRQGHLPIVVADANDRYASLAISCLVDMPPNCGPMGGLAAALTHRRTIRDDSWLLLVACDQLVWDRTWTRNLWQTVQPGLQAIVFQAGPESDPLLQPVPGLYHTSLLPLVQKSIASRQYSLRRMLKNSAVGIANCADNPRNWSFNTMDELNRQLTRLPGIAR